MTAKPPAFIKRIGRSLADFLLPPVCLVCGDDTDGNFLCAKCFSLIQTVERSFCQLCGQPLRISRHSYICPECVKHPLALHRIRTWAIFTHPLDKLVYAFKYSNFKKLALFFSRQLALIIQNDANLRDAEMLIPIPIHFLKKWWRGYNQTEILGKVLSERCGIPMFDALKRIKLTRTQTKLSVSQRQSNLAHAFKHKKTISVRNKKVIVLDDVITSGATMDAAAEVLLEAGAAQVYGLSIGGAWIKRSS